MANNSNSNTVPNGTYKLKLGKSFLSRPEEFYHTIRYDFKPASLEECKESYVEFGPKGETTISMPKTDASGDVKDVTLFKGSRKPHQKECLLIFDHDTGEFTLEELTYGIQVKQVRSGEEEKEKTLNYVREIRNACKFNNHRLSPIPKREIEDDNNNNVDVLMMSDNDSTESSDDDDEKESSGDDDGVKKEISDSSGSEDDMAKTLEAAVAKAKKKLSDHLKINAAAAAAAGSDNKIKVEVKIETDEIKVEPEETKSDDSNSARSSQALRKDILDNDLRLSDDSSEEDGD